MKQSRKVSRSAKPAKDTRSVKCKDRSTWITRRADEISLRMSGLTLVHTNAIIRRVALDVAANELASIEAGRPMLHGGYMPPLPSWIER